MTLAHKLGLSVFALLCSAQFALAQEATKPQAPTPAPAHWYDTVAGTQNGFQARPVIGGLYSLMTLN